MVSPFFGCVFGGFLYDLLMFTGESPINEEYMGLGHIIPGLSSEHKEKTERSLV
jgi:aquaglyceroporin related protein